jgi:transketolase
MDSSAHAAPAIEQIRHDADDPLWLDRDRVLRVASQGATQAGATQAGATQAGATQAGATQAGATQAGATQADAALAELVPGPPGLAFGAALGMAWAERLLAARFGRSLVDHRIWLLADGLELASGTAHEAAAIAGQLGMGRLIVLAQVEQAELPALARFEAMGWTLRRIHDPAAQLGAAIAAALRAHKPTLIAFSAITQAGSQAGVPPLAASPRAAGARRSWLKRLRRHAAQAPFHQAFGGLVAPRLATAPLAADSAASMAGPLEALNTLFHRAATLLPDIAYVPPIAAGAGSAAAGQGAWLHAADASDAAWQGRYQARSAALLGMAMHGGALPVGRFPALACDAIQPATRAAGALGLRLVHIMTGCPPALAAGLYDSGLVAENTAVFNPADAAEAIECAGLALRRQAGPSTLIVSGTVSGAPARHQGPASGCAHGGYLLADSIDAHVTLIGSGADIGVALALQPLLAQHGISAAIASIPCLTLFLAQDQAYRDSILGRAPRIVLAAGGAPALCLALRPGDLLLAASPAAEALAARIARHLARGAPAPSRPDGLPPSRPDGLPHHPSSDPQPFLEDYAPLLETGGDMD